MQITLDPLPTAVFAAVILCWIAFAALFIFRKKPQAEAASKERRRASVSLFGIILQGFGYAFIWAVRRPYFSPPARMNRALEVALAIFTVALAVASVWFVTKAVTTLGKEWSFAARVREGHRLVTEGPYKIVRNPIYTGMLGMLVSTGLATSHWIGLLTGLVIFIAGTLIRVRSEEKILREEFGQEFDAYRARVPAIIPGIY